MAGVPCGLPLMSVALLLPGNTLISGMRFLIPREVSHWMHPTVTLFLLSFRACVHWSWTLLTRFQFRAHHWHARNRHPLMLCFLIRMKMMDYSVSAHKTNCSWYLPGRSIPSLSLICRQKPWSFIYDEWDVTWRRPPSLDEVLFSMAAYLLNLRPV